MPARSMHVRPLVAIAALCVAAAACADDDGTSTPDLAGVDVEVLGVWQDAEAAAFEQVLDGFEAETGATVTFTSTAGEDVADVLDPRLDAGDPPDVAVLPQPGLLARYAASGAVLPLDDLVGDEVDAGWAPEWRRLGTVDGRLYGVWFKAAHKSLVWYSIGAFEAAGVVPPDDLDGLRVVADRLRTNGLPAFALTAEPSDAWTLTDWFENLYLRLAGPARYDALARHDLPWTDPSVADALRAMADLVAADGAAAGDATTFPESVAAVFDPRPAAAMVMEGDFVPGVVAGSTEGLVGIDVDVFPFPGASPPDRFVVGGGDALALLRDGEGGRALVRYLTSAAAGEAWAAIGGFVSPNEAVDLTAYRDPVARRIARSLLEAGDGFRFDLSDLQPVEFGGTTGEGLWAELARFVVDPSDVDGTMARLEAAADAAWSS